MCVAAVGGPGASYADDITPLEHAHAHNDYLHAHPLFDALDNGFTSVEADIFFVDGKLLVAHKRGEIRPHRTLESLYLEPLARRIKENGGGVYKDAGRFFLLVDIKDEPNATYAELRRVLAKYAELLTSVEGGKFHEGDVTIVLTGKRPQIKPSNSEVRYVGLDGLPEELPSEVPSHFMPMISDKWSNEFTWKGDGEMPADERAKLRALVKRTHDEGRVLRFWETPEKESVWRELRAANVDLINTDQLARLAKFLNEEKKSTSTQ